MGTWLGCGGGGGRGEPPLYFSVCVTEEYITLYSSVKHN
jgi:hypothetical protein